MNYIPENLKECTIKYLPPIKEYINCPNFGNSDGTNGACWWCMEMTPYQHEMCSDETWIKGLLSPISHFSGTTREEAIEFIDNYKKKFPHTDIITNIYKLRALNEEIENSLEQTTNSTSNTNEQPEQILDFDF